MTILLLLATLASAASEFKTHSDLEGEIQGEWLAAEYYVEQPPADLQQSITSISFQPSNVVTWISIEGGTLRTNEGRYGIYSFQTREAPSLTVAPLRYPTAVFSSQILLSLTEVTLDFDSRFPMRFGKLLKVKGQDNRQLLFIRKENKISSQPAGGAYVAPAVKFPR